MKKFRDDDVFHDDENDLYKNEDVYDMEYEQYFFELIGGSKNIYVLPFPDEDGEYLTPQELSIVKKTCRRQNLKLMFKISHGNGFSTIISSDTKLTGIMPENEQHGFYC